MEIMLFTRSRSVTLRLNSVGPKLAPMLTAVLQKSMAEGLWPRADAWYSLAPVSSKIRRKFLSVIPPPGTRLVVFVGRLQYMSAVLILVCANVLPYATGLKRNA